MKRKSLALLLFLLTAAACRKEGSQSAEAADGPGGSRAARPSLSKGESGRPPFLNSSLQTPEDIDRVKRELGSLDTAGLASLVAELSEDRSSQRGAVLFELAIAELAGRDPAAALAWFSKPEMLAYTAGFAEVALTVGRKNPELLKQWMQQSLALCPAQTQMSYCGLAFEGLSRDEPKGALDLLLQQKLAPQVSISALHNVMFNFAKQDPDAAQKAALENLKGIQLDFAIGDIAMIVAPDNAAKGLEIAKKIPGASRRDEMVSRVVASWLEKDPASAGRYLGAMQPSDIQALLSQRPTQPDSLLSALSRKNPEALLGMLGQVIPTDANKKVFEVSVRNLLDSNPDGAMALVSNMPEGGLRNEVLESLYEAKAQKDPGEALASALAMGDAAGRVRGVEAIASEVGKSGSEGLKAMMGQLPPDLRPAFVAAAIPSIALQDVKEAATLLVEVDGAGQPMIEPGKRKELLPDIAEGLSRADAAYAREWLDKLSPDEQPAAMTGIAKNLVKTDIAGFADSLANGPHDARWAAGTKVLIGELRKSDPANADLWQAELKRSGYK